MLTDLNQGGKLTDISYLSCTVSVRSDVTVWRLKKDPPVLFWYVFKSCVYDDLSIVFHLSIQYMDKATLGSSAILGIL